MRLARYPDLVIRRLHFIFFLTHHVSEGPKGTKPPVVQGGLQSLSNRFFCDLSHSLLLLQHLSGLEDAVLRNIQAVAELSDLVRTSFGPNGAVSISPPPPPTVCIYVFIPDVESP